MPARSAILPLAYAHAHSSPRRHKLRSLRRRSSVLVRRESSGSPTRLPGDRTAASPSQSGKGSQNNRTAGYAPIREQRPLRFAPPSNRSPPPLAPPPPPQTTRPPPHP